MKRIKPLIVFLAVIFLGACASSGQKPIAADVAAGKGEITVSSIPQDSKYPLGTGDTLNISVFRHSDLNMESVRIRPDGMISFPLIGEVKARGLTIDELRRDMETKLGAYVIAPQVIINPASLGSQRIYVLGEVSSPGMQSIEENISVLQAVTKAGGLSTSANSSIIVVRKNIAYEIDFGKLYKGDGTQNMMLQGGDMVYVPPSGIVATGRYMDHIARILGPFVTIESGIVLAPQVRDALKGTTGSSSVSIPAK